MVEDQNLLPSQEQDPRIFHRLMQRAGIEGNYQNYQNYLIIIIYIISYLSGGCSFIFPYLFYQDPYICPQMVGGNNCRAYICSLPSEQRLAYVPSPSIYTLANQFGDYRCDSQKMKIEFVITAMFCGRLATSLFSSLAGDLVGRKMLMVGNLLLYLTGLILTLFSVSLSMAAVGLFITFFGMRGILSSTYYFTAETMEKEQRGKCEVSIQLFYGVGVLLNVLWYWIFANWKVVFILFYMIPLIIVLISFVFFVQDTPMCLVTRYQPEEVLKAFRFIARVNNIQPFEMQEDEIKHIKLAYQLKLKGQSNSGKTVFSILDLFRYKSLKNITIILIITQCIITFQFYAPALMIDQFDFSLFVNGLVIGLAELVTAPICLTTINTVKRTVMAFRCFLAAFICSIILFFSWDQNAVQNTASLNNSIGVLVFIFLYRFSISIEDITFYVHKNECFPTQVRVLGTSLISALGALTVTLAPIILQLSVQGGFPIMLIFATLSGCGLLLSKKLPQTLGVIPQQQILKLKNTISMVEMKELVKNQLNCSKQNLSFQFVNKNIVSSEIVKKNSMNHEYQLK